MAEMQSATIGEMQSTARTVHVSTTRIAHVSTHKISKCAHCEQSLGGLGNFEFSVNHYLEEHEYLLLHIGTETVIGPSGVSSHATIAVLGN